MAFISPKDGIISATLRKKLTTELNILYTEQA